MRINTSFYCDFWWKTQFLGLIKTFFQINLRDSEWYSYDPCVAAFRIRKFHFNPKLYVKNLAKLTENLPCGKRSNWEIIIDTIFKFNTIILRHMSNFYVWEIFFLTSVVSESAFTKFSVYFYGKLYFLAFFSKTNQNRKMAVGRSLVYSIVNIHAKFEVSTFHSPFTLVPQSSFMGLNTSFCDDFWWKTRFLGLKEYFSRKACWFRLILLRSFCCRFSNEKIYFNPKL